MLHITLEFQGDAAGTEEIDLPSWWASNGSHPMTNLQAISDGTTIADGTESDIKVLRYAPSTRVVLAYDLKKDWTVPFRAPLQFHPVILPEYIEINGQNGLLHPKIDSQATVTVHFDWHELPVVWSLATSFGASSNAAGRCQSYSGTWKEAEEALFAAGDFRIHRFEIRGHTAVLAIRGQWNFTDEEAITDIQKVVGIVRDFWHDYDFPYFLVTIAPYEQERGSNDGSGFTNAFWLFMSHQSSISSPNLLVRLAHESFHTWNIRRMGVPAKEQADFDWFHEGFTDYYGYLLVYRAELLSLPDYLEATNRDLRLYATSTSPYVRGLVVATWLDGEIRKESKGTKSLDNVMFDMVRENDKPLNDDRILATIDRYLSPDDRVSLRKAVEHGVMPKIDQNALGSCVTLSMNNPTFDLGFDPASRNDKKIMGVRKDGPAFKAGLRDGQIMTAWSLSMDHPDTIVKITIQTEGGKQNIEYYPRGVLTVQQFHLDRIKYDSEPSNCVVR